MYADDCVCWVMFGGIMILTDSNKGLTSTVEAQIRVTIRTWFAYYSWCIISLIMEVDTVVRVVCERYESVIHGIGSASIFMN